MLKMRSNYPAYEDCYHFIASAKYRKNLFYDDTIRNRLKDIIVEVVSQMGGVELVTCTAAYNHVHVLVKSEMNPSDIARVLFSNSSRKLRREFPVLVEKAEKALWGGKSCTAIKDANHYNNCVSYIARHRPDNTKDD